MLGIFNNSPKFSGSILQRANFIKDHAFFK